MALFMVGYIVVLTDAIGAPPTSSDSLDPRSALTYELVRSVGMGFLLILTL